jgi:hypothetical protein
MVPVIVITDGTPCEFKSSGVLQAWPMTIGTGKPVELVVVLSSLHANCIP